MRLRRVEKQGGVVLCLLIALLFFLPELVGNKRQPPFLLARVEAGDSKPGNLREDTLPPPKKHVTPRPPSVSKRPPPPLVELNSADSIALVKVRGIGAYYASRILRYRALLGGFYSTGQLKELNGKYLSFDTLLHLFTVDPALIRKKALDTMSFRSMLRHPYLEYEDVELIFNAKRAAGDSLSYSLLEEKKVLVPQKLKKIKPYFQ
ncbi:MAG: helix-hairpin-helix domain-containing protein [Odoribacteraceae bacterium]|jgi:hypothetical protein|nr:helix-hairpin-helix domain-containing protein [Odoribacteraceae bacterium]